MARRICNRGRPKKKPNRYNPNRPDWSAVHGNRMSRMVLFPRR